MSQETFNKIVTIILLVYFMSLYAASWIMNKPVDIAGLAAFLVPIVTHGLHIVTQSSIERTTIKAKNGTLPT